MHWKPHTCRHNLSSTHTFHTSLWANKAECKKQGQDKWYNDIQARLVSGVEREDEEDDEEEGQAVAALNVGIIFHLLTVSLHIMLKHLQGEEEGRWEKCWRAPIMTALCFHTHLSTLSSYFGLSQPFLPLLFFHLVPDVFSKPLFLSAFVHSVCHGRNEELLGRESTHLRLPSRFLFSLWFKWGDSFTLWASPKTIK